MFLTVKKSCNALQSVKGHCLVICYASISNTHYNALLCKPDAITGQVVSINSVDQSSQHQNVPICGASDSFTQGVDGEIH